MRKDGRAIETGAGIFWRAVQEIGVNVIFLGRILLLTRLLTPVDFGLVAIALTGVGFLISTTTLGTIPALIQYKDASEHDYHAAWTVGLGRALLITVGALLAAPLIASIFDEPRAVNVVRALAFLPLIEALASIKMARLIRELQFKPVAITRLIDATTNTLFAILLAPRFGMWALVIGALVGSIAAAITSYMVAPYVPRLSFARARVQPLIHYGRWLFLTSLISFSGAAILRVVITRQLGAAELGLYFLAAKLAFFPSGVASEVVGAVAFPAYARIQSSIAHANSLFRVLLVNTAVLLLPIFGLMIALAPSLVTNVMGVAWEGTAPLIQVLALVGAVGLFTDNVVPLVKGLGQPYRFTFLEGSQSVVLLVFVTFFVARYGLIGVALAWIPTAIATLLLAILFVRQVLPGVLGGLDKPLIGATLASILAAMTAANVANWIPGLLGLVAATTTGVVSAALALWFLERRFALGLMLAFKQIFPQLVTVIGSAPAES